MGKKKLLDLMSKQNVRIFKLEQRVSALEHPDGPGGAKPKAKVKKPPKDKMVRKTETK